MPPQIFWFPLLCHYRIVCVISYPLCLCPAILFPVVLLWQAYIILTERARIVALRACIMFEHSMYQRSIPFPCSQVVCLSILSEASLRFSEHRFFFLGWGTPTPNPQPGGPGCPFLSGPSPLTCPAWVTLPVATLPPA